MIIVFVIESYIDGRNVTPRGFFWMVTPRPYENEHICLDGVNMIKWIYKEWKRKKFWYIFVAIFSSLSGWATGIYLGL